MLAVRTRTSAGVILHVIPCSTPRGCDLGGLRLRRALLSGFDLRGANLEGADLTSADLQDADLRGANLTRAELTNALLGGALYDDATLWPGGFEPGPAGAIRRLETNEHRVCRAELEALRLGAVLRAREVRQWSQTCCRRSHQLAYLAGQVMDRCRDVRTAIEQANTRKPNPGSLRARMFMSAGESPERSLATRGLLATAGPAKPPARARRRPNPPPPQSTPRRAAKTRAHPPLW